MKAETDDSFLGGRLNVWQPERGYRAGTDAVLLAAAVPAEPGQAVLELGCGTGVVLLRLACRVGGLSLTGVERNADHAALCRRNCDRNGTRAEIAEGDALDPPAEVKKRRFDHVVANPPYLDRRRGLAGDDAAREGAIAAQGSLTDWAATGFRRVRPGGWLTMIAPAVRLPEILAATGGAGVSVRPVAARAGRDPDRILVCARKGARAPFRLMAPLVVHAGPAHIDDRGDDFAPEMRAILRDGAALDATFG